MQLLQILQCNTGVPEVLYYESTESKVMAHCSFATTKRQPLQTTILISTHPSILSRLHSRYSLHQFAMSLLQRVRDNGNCPPSLLGDERNVGDVVFDALISRILDPAAPNSKCVCDILTGRSRLLIFEGLLCLCFSYILGTPSHRYFARL
jgi:hypothetical protein